MTARGGRCSAQGARPARGPAPPAAEPEAGRRLRGDGGGRGPRGYVTRLRGASPTGPERRAAFRVRPPDGGRAGRGASRGRGKARSRPGPSGPRAAASSGGRAAGRARWAGPLQPSALPAGSDAPEAAGSGRVTARAAPPAQAGPPPRPRRTPPARGATLSRLSVSPQPVTPGHRGRDRPGREAAGMNHVLTRGADGSRSDGARPPRTSRGPRRGAALRPGRAREKAGGGRAAVLREPRAWKAGPLGRPRPAAGSDLLSGGAPWVPGASDAASSRRWCLCKRT